LRHRCNLKHIKHAFTQRAGRPGHRWLRFGWGGQPQAFLDGVVWLSLEELGQQAVLTMLFERLPTLTPEELMVFAGIPTDQLRHTRAAQMLLEEGEARGEARGRAAEAASVTLRQLNRRCGPLTDATTARIQALPLEQLEGLAEALLDFTGPAELATWLADHTG
jgi:hypothetical protein